MTTVGLMADPGLPATIAHSIVDDLTAHLTETFEPPGEDQDWRVEISRGTLPITSDGIVPLMQHAQDIQEDKGWDYLFYLLDLPQWHEGQPLLSVASSSPAAALISIPAVGSYRLRGRTKRILVMLLQAMQDSSQSRTDSRPMRRKITWQSPDDEVWYIIAPGRINRTRLLAGMVRSNRPVRILSALSHSFAAAIATGAFGVFYASLWNLADKSSTLRLVIISFLSIGILTTWLIANNKLWDRNIDQAHRRRGSRDNVATILTLGIAVLLFHMALYLVLLLGALIVISPSYLEAQVGHDISAIEYLQLAWLSASLGTLAGALGSNFDDDSDIERATYSRRVYHRRQTEEER